MFQHRRLSFTRPSGAAGSLTMSANHMFVKLTAAAVGNQANSVAACEYLDSGVCAWEERKSALPQPHGLPAGCLVLV
jgi:hypothetical protein